MMVDYSSDCFYYSITCKLPGHTFLRMCADGLSISDILFRGTSG